MLDPEALSQRVLCTESTKPGGKRESGPGWGPAGGPGSEKDRSLKTSQCWGRGRSWNLSFLPCIRPVVHLPFPLLPRGRMLMDEIQSINRVLTWQRSGELRPSFWVWLSGWDFLLECFCLLSGTGLGTPVLENETRAHGEISTRLFPSAGERGCSKSPCKEEETLPIGP